MPVISGNGAEKLYRIQFAPGGASQYAMRITAADGIIHDIEGGVAVNDNIIWIVLHHVAKQNTCFINARQLAIITAVGAIITGEIRIGIENIHHAHRQVQLFLAGLSAAHIEMEFEVLKTFIFFL